MTVTPGLAAVWPPDRSFGTTALTRLAALTIVLAGMRAVGDIFGPVFLALVISIALHPLRVRLESRRLPAWATSLLLLSAAYLLIVGLVLALVLSVSHLAALVPQYSAQIRDLVQRAASALEAAGVDQAQIDAISTSLDPGRLFELSMAVLASSFDVLANVFFLVTLLLFFTFDTDSTRRGLSSLRKSFPAQVAALSNFAQRTREYMRVSSGFGFIVAVIDGIVLYALDVPGAFVWAVLAFVTNFIPNVGFVIGVVPPALIALLDSGPGLMLTVIVLYSVINFVIQSIIQPRVVGDTVGLSATLTFLSLVFWTWVLGPVGAVLAVPLSLFVRSMLVESDEHHRWALPIIAGKAEAPLLPPIATMPRTPQEDDHG